MLVPNLVYDEYDIWLNATCALFRVQGVYLAEASSKITLMRLCFSNSFFLTENNLMHFIQKNSHANA